MTMMTAHAITHSAPREIASRLVPDVERLGKQVSRVLRHYICRRDGDGQLRDVPLRAMYLVADQDEPYAAIEVDVNRLGPGVRLNTLLEKDLVHDIRIATGHSAWAVEENGVTYVLTMAARRRTPLPTCIRLNLADRPAGEYVLGFGLSHSGQLWGELDDMTHVIVAGSSDSGKSACLRSLVWQLRHQLLPVDLYLTDMEGLTFAWAAKWSMLKMPIAQDVPAATEITRHLLAEIKRRAQLYDTTGRYPEKLSEYHAVGGKRMSDETRLPWIVAVFDEFSALAEAAGKNSELLNNISQLAQRSRKYGVTLILAGQDFKADLLNTRITNQLKTRIQFRCARREQSQIVLGRSGAEKITTPGRALMWLEGKLVEIQSFWVPKETIIRASGGHVEISSAGPTLSDDERMVAEVVMKPTAEGGLGGEYN
ncbi:MAG: hypothetical protein JW850_03105, partial [Thermoflexales bacterium]|nr:hypothetical protein [Thermoflexales bacterium]